jgi:hypothetical protein
MKLLGRCLFVFVVCLPLIACLSATHKRDKIWGQEFTYIKLTRKNFEESAKLNFDCSDYLKKTTSLNWVQQANCYMDDSANTPAHTSAQKIDLRNWIIENFVTVANHAFGDYEHDSLVWHTGLVTGFDFINLGLTAATTVTGMATTLGAVSTGTQGASHSFTKHVYNDQTAFVINSKMEALRLTQLSTIREREALPVDCPAGQNAPDATKGSQPKCYTLAQAMNDVQELYYDGTIHRALQDINTQSSQQTNDAQKKLRTMNSEPLK